MRFTAQEEYGLRCLVQIAKAPEGFLTIAEIAARESLTTANVAKLMGVLRRADLVKSTRGQNGGYQLARPSGDIDLAHVLDVLGGRLYSREFCQRFVGNEHVCVHDTDCSLRALWASVEVVVHRALSGRTLQDLLCTEREMKGRLAADPGHAARALAPNGRGRARRAGAAVEAPAT